jgi:hypothetical protein
MKLSAVLLARVIFFIESVELNPRGAAYYPDIVKGLVERYGFQKFPEKFEDFDEQKGVVFSSGRLGKRTVEKVTIHNWGLTLDTTSSTRDSEELLIEALTWSAEHLKLHYNPDLVKRKAYVSHVIFYSDAPLLSMNPVLDVVANRISKEVTDNLKFPYVFHPRGISLSIDPAEQRIPIQAFSIERREGIAFAENKYWSAAPVSTDTHIALIEEFERAAQRQREAANR